MRLAALTAGSVLALAACSQDAAARQDVPPETPVEQAAGDMAAPGVQTVDAGGQLATFQNAWIRTPPAGRDLAAGYVFIDTREPDALVRARSQAADRVELHTMSMDDNVMRMRRVERIEIGPDGTALEPGGNHFMIFGLSETARLSGTVLIELSFESGLTAPVEFQIGDTMPGLQGPHGEAEPGDHH